MHGVDRGSRDLDVPTFPTRKFLTIDKLQRQDVEQKLMMARLCCLLWTIESYLITTGTCPCSSEARSKQNKSLSNYFRSFVIRCSPLTSVIHLAFASLPGIFHSWSTLVVVDVIDQKIRRRCRVTLSSPIGIDLGWKRLWAENFLTLIEILENEKELILIIRDSEEPTRVPTHWEKVNKLRFWDIFGMLVNRIGRLCRGNTWSNEGIVCVYSSPYCDSFIT